MPVIPGNAIIMGMYYAHFMLDYPMVINLFSNSTVKTRVWLMTVLANILILNQQIRLKCFRAFYGVLWTSKKFPVESITRNGACWKSGIMLEYAPMLPVTILYTDIIHQGLIKSTNDSDGLTHYYW